MLQTKKLLIITPGIRTQHLITRFGYLEFHRSCTKAKSVPNVGITTM